MRRKLLNLAADVTWADYRAAILVGVPFLTLQALATFKVIGEAWARRYCIAMMVAILIETAVRVTIRLRRTTKGRKDKNGDAATVVTICRDPSASRR
jgi:hypothetical protein